jgi:hypothetical protein
MKDKKTILSEIKDLIFGTEKKFMDLKSGEYIIRVEGDSEIAEKMPVFMVTPDGLMPMEDGEYPLDDKAMKIFVVGGMIDKVEEEEEMADEAEVNVEDDVMEMAETTLMDGTKVKVEGDVAVGNAVTVEVDGEYIKAPEGQHNLADGRVIFVDAEGKINEIETPDTRTVEEELEVAVEAAPFVDENGDLVKEKPSMDDLMARLIKCEEVINEMMSAQKEMSTFSKEVGDKIDEFIKDTPAELEFKSLKTEFNRGVVIEKNKVENNLEAIKNIRAKK